MLVVKVDLMVAPPHRSCNSLFEQDRIQRSSAHNSLNVNRQMLLWRTLICIFCVFFILPSSLLEPKWQAWNGNISIQLNSIIERMQICIWIIIIINLFWATVLCLWMQFNEAKTNQRRSKSVVWFNSTSIFHGNSLWKILHKRKNERQFNRKTQSLKCENIRKQWNENILAEALALRIRCVISDDSSLVKCREFRPISTKADYFNQI